VASAVREGTTELGFVEGAVEDPMLASQPAASDRAAVAGSDHAWAIRGE
jgi:hypothetical protein